MDVPLPDDDSFAPHRVLLSGAVWLGLSGAAVLNQHQLLRSLTGQTAAGVSVILWVGHSLACLLVLSLMATGPLEQRLSFAARTWFLLAIPFWATLGLVFYMRAAGMAIIAPTLLVTTAGLTVLGCRRPLCGWIAGLVLAGAGAGAVLFPLIAPFLVAGACVVLVALAAMFAPRAQ